MWFNVSWARLFLMHCALEDKSNHWSTSYRSQMFSDSFIGYIYLLTRSFRDHIMATPTEPIVFLITYTFMIHGVFVMDVES